MSDLKKKIPVIVGPTASGKTVLSIALAKRLQGEIISADSRQVYKYLDIGTDKPSANIRRTIPHHFIDYKKPDEYFSAGEFGREARQKIQELLDQDKWPLVVGGSGLYLRALTDGLFGPRVSDREIKQSLHQLRGSPAHAFTLPARSPVRRFNRNRPIMIPLRVSLHDHAMNQKSL